MSSELGQLFSDGLTYNPAIFDAKTIVVMPGSYITAIPSTVEYAAARALDSTGGLRKDEMYYPNAARNQIIPVHWSHRHQSGDHWNGGSHQDIVLANEREIHNYILGATPEELFSGVSGSGIVDRNTSGRTRVRTGLTMNSWARVWKGGAGMGFANKIFWRARLMVNDNLGQLVRFGCRMEDPANNADNLEKFGLEGCDGDGPNYRLVTSNGVGRHKEPTALPIEQTFQRGYAMLLEPGTTVTLQYDDGTTLSETNNIPSTGTFDDTSAIKLGIKTTNSNEKVLTLTSLEAFGISAISSWTQMNITA
jgi:hypothetical protein